MAHLGYDKNEYGTRISRHRCDTCGEDFTVCPAQFPEATGWANCMAPTCASYDPARDVDVILANGGSLVQGQQKGSA